MALIPLDPKEFTDNGRFTEDGFLAVVAGHDFARFAGKHVLVRGCGLPIPPWAYMHLTARLVGVARSIRYGNEHDNIVVYRAAHDPEKSFASEEPNA